MIGVIVPIGIGGIVFFGLWFWAVLDCIAMDSILVRNLPKQTWIFIVLFIPTAGALAWLLLGRPEGAGLSVGGTYRPPNYNQRGPKARGFEDSVAWESTKDHVAPIEPAKAAATESDGESAAVKERRLLEWEAELAKREQALDQGDAGADDA